ncbi:hypothetical protein NM688_g9369 [Phlebia brevispora]|uniref:Uncharacterized protein n=1 Tax=Phlebia brevispora TaxID=194682 RepID=A0ACC1RKP3_9APHY|nr:hypothetical protein NM688_g9369 [Phlebia brevispora]
MAISRRLKSGKYHIYSQATNSMVGRAEIEEQSLNQKAVFALGSDIPESDRDADRLLWTIECGSCDGLYKMKVKDTPVGQEEKLLYAFPDEKDKKKVEEWFIRAVPQIDEAAYIIQTSDESAGWDAPESGDAKHKMKQIDVHALPKLPPNPCPESRVSQVFIIKPVKDES